MTLYLPKTYASMEVDAHIEHMRHDRLEFSLILKLPQWGEYQHHCNVWFRYHQKVKFIIIDSL